MGSELQMVKAMVEVDLFMINATIQETRGDRPFLPYTLLVVDSQSGMILGSDLAVADPDLDAAWLEAQNSVLKVFKRMGGIPWRIVVRDEWQADLFAHIAHHLGIELYVSARLPALDEARFAFEQRMGWGF